ncbi:hypothetical protein INE82_01239 [Bacteroides thetaiotaomicron]|jgi:hypothetical protein|nr:hypothetical protein INE82_01239 [Bacteroides thetaiotaomicron]
MNTNRSIPMDYIESQFNQYLKLSNNKRIIFSGRNPHIYCRKTIIDKKLHKEKITYLMVLHK